jgi:hypothetical protein
VSITDTADTNAITPAAEAPRKSYRLDMEPGSTWLFFVPPGWIVGGTVDSIDGDVLHLYDAVHLEGVASGHSLMSSISTCTVPKKLAEICPTAWGYPHGFQILLSAALMRVPCRISLRQLALARDAAALAGA